MEGPIKLSDKIDFIKCDISKLKENGVIVEAIVNAAKPSLEGGNGVDGAIHKAAGSKLLEECLKIPAKPYRCSPGEVKLTEGYELCQYIIHTVGPKWRVGAASEFHTLRQCYKNIIKFAYENNIKSIAIPIISTGSYAFPFDKASKVAIATTINSLIKYNTIEKVYFVIFSDTQFNIFNSIFQSFIKNIENEELAIDLNAFESQKSYINEVLYNDKKKNGVFGILFIVRFMLVISPFIFPLTLAIRNFAGRKKWKRRRIIIEIEVILKAIFPIILLFLNAGDSFYKNLLSFILAYFILETLCYISSIIFLSDIQKASANRNRSLILLGLNFLEINFSFAFLYNASKLFEKPSIVDYIYFSFDTAKDMPNTFWGKILVLNQELILIYLTGIAIIFFTSELKKTNFIR